MLDQINNAAITINITRLKTISMRTTFANDLASRFKRSGTLT